MLSVCRGCAPGPRRRRAPSGTSLASPGADPDRKLVTGPVLLSTFPARGRQETFIPPPWSLPSPGSLPPRPPPFFLSPILPKGWWEVRLFISRPYSRLLLHHPPQVILSPPTKHPHFRSCWYLSTPAKKVTAEPCFCLPGFPRTPPCLAPRSHKSSHQPLLRLLSITLFSSHGRSSLLAARGFL